MAAPNAVLTQVKDFVIGRGERDRNCAIPPSVIFKLCMEVRLASNRDAINQLLGGRYVIKAQSLQFHQPIAHGNNPLNVRVSQGVGHVGDHSFEYMYSIYHLQGEQSDLLATVCVVCVAVKAPGEKLPLPAAFKALATQAQQPELAAARRASHHDTLTQGLRELHMPAITAGEQDTLTTEQGKEAPTLNQALIRAEDAAYFAMPVLLRPSDEDWNHHLNNVSYVHFFEDALEIVRELAHVEFGVRDVEAIAVDYLRECTLSVRGCRVLVQLQPGPDARAIEDGSQHVPGAGPTLAFVFQGKEADGSVHIYARGRVLATAS
eukprot:m.23420 g.23420  ORF g.23420 m.23420 type:complete len:320 (-) comp11380_c0_seq1:37-996(-)